MHARRAGRVGVVAGASTLLLTGLTVVAPAAFAAAPARYTITDLGSLGTGDLSVAKAVNNAGVVVGYSDPTASTVHGFKWGNGALTDLGTLPGGEFSWANAINDAGQIAGTADRPPVHYGYPVRWSASGAITDLGGTIDNALGVGNAIDPSGQVAGGQRPADSEGSPLGTLYRADGTRVDLEPDLGVANGINAVGQVVGEPSYIWRDGTVTFLPGFPGTGSTRATAINISGTVVGSAGAGENELAVRWQGTNPVGLGGVAGIPYSTANAINAAGQIVGTADPLCTPCAAPRAWLWQTGTLTLLDDLVPAGSGWSLQQANGINDRGQIVGAGLHNGHLRAYLLTPVYSVSVNFAPAGAPVPVGYRADTGLAYGPRASGLTYGWNVDNSANARDRNAANSPDQRYDTFNHMQKPAGATRWELALPNGRYLVHLVAGDPTATDSTYRLTAEGQLVVSGTPTASQPWIEGTAVVAVTDGRLTIANGSGSVNDKISYLDVTGA
jgi:probable HAF family extracellular repeat protein